MVCCVVLAVTFFFFVRSGTGALRLGAEFCAKFMPDKPVLVSDPTWPNHIGVFEASGVEIRRYRWIDPVHETLALDHVLEDLTAAPEGSIVLLHACAHNPTGVDPNHEEWNAIADVCVARGLKPFFDCAYQGFASGDLDRDAWAVRMFASRGMPVMAAQSFSKNFGLYGERVGCFTAVAATEEEKPHLKSNIKVTARRMYSNPGLYGARIVYTVLSDPELRDEWYGECRIMAKRINDMRQLLRAKLEEFGQPHEWDHITSQIGMFSYTGLTPEQCDALKRDFHIYLPRNGRVSMAGVTHGNAERLAKAMVSVMGIAKKADGE